MPCLCQGVTLQGEAGGRKVEGKRGRGVGVSLFRRSVVDLCAFVGMSNQNGLDAHEDVDVSVRKFEILSLLNTVINNFCRS
jgi:hypothetical protein